MAATGILASVLFSDPFSPVWNRSNSSNPIAMGMKIACPAGKIHFRLDRAGGRPAIGSREWLRFQSNRTTSRCSITSPAVRHRNISVSHESTMECIDWAKFRRCLSVQGLTSSSGGGVSLILNSMEELHRRQSQHNGQFQMLNFEKSLRLAVPFILELLGFAATVVTSVQWSSGSYFATWTL
ncbi:hypothetical protein M569_13793 [Genlisea aurea]|uniref:Uncharacterized protein n=1 Tax=Genlisea aurea TaxID=192259 RepID=S8C2H1_9LAMI|nr:hypothetical protein M569_13793 [Genlisea aurea]